MNDLGLRERKKRETRLALSRAAIRLCVERGWDDVTVDDIAEAATVSPRTFRNYFTSKAEAIAASHLERALSTADELRARPPGEPLWEALVHAVSVQYVAEPDAVAGSAWMAGIRLVLAEPAVHGEVLKADAIAKDELAAAIAERTGTDVADVYPQLVAAVVAAASAVVVGRWLRSDPTESVVPALRAVFDQVRAGLPEPGKGQR